MMCCPIGRTNPSDDRKAAAGTPAFKKNAGWGAGQLVGLAGTTRADACRLGLHLIRDQACYMDDDLTSMGSRAVFGQEDALPGAEG